MKLSYNYTRLGITRNPSMRLLDPQESWNTVNENGIVTVHTRYTGSGPARPEWDNEQGWVGHLRERPEADAMAPTPFIMPAMVRRVA
jgi:hypothetical protein